MARPGTVDNVEELDILHLRRHAHDASAPRATTSSTRSSRAGGRRGEIYARLRDLRDRYADADPPRFPDIPRRVSGYNLDELLPENGFHVARALVGTEGTCVTVLERKLRLVHSRPCRSLLVLGYPDVYEAADHVAEVMRVRAASASRASTTCSSTT